MTAKTKKTIPIYQGIDGGPGLDEFGDNIAVVLRTDKPGTLKEAAEQPCGIPVGTAHDELRFRGILVGADETIIDRPKHARHDDNQQ